MLPAFFRRPRASRVAALVIACIGVSAAAHAQELTLLQAVPLEDAAQEADLILVGSLTRPVPRPSPDDGRVFSTDYELEIDEFVIAKQGTVPTFWMFHSLIVRQSAGEVPSDYALVNASPNIEAVLTPGRTLLAFLTFDKAIQRYRITRDFVFEIDGDQRLKALASARVDPRLNGMPLRDVILELKRLLPAAEVSQERTRQLLNCRRTDPVDRTPVPLHRRTALRAALADRIPVTLAVIEPSWAEELSSRSPSDNEWRHEVKWREGGRLSHLRWYIAADVESAHREFHNVLGRLAACVPPREAFADDIGDEAVPCSSHVLYFRYRHVYVNLYTSISDPTLSRRVATQIVEEIKAALEIP